MSDGKNNALELELAEIKERERQRLEHTIEQLELELAEKNKQIDKLTTTIENMTETTELQNKLLDNLRLQIKTPVMLPPVRRSWWQRIFGK
jgi:flagellar biosynthesis regulator FlaF